MLNSFMETRCPMLGRWGSLQSMFLSKAWRLICGAAIILNLKWIISHFHFLLSRVCFLFIKHCVCMMVCQPFLDLSLDITILMWVVYLVFANIIMDGFSAFREGLV